LIRASVVVPTFTRAKLLPSLLESLVGQEYDGQYEVLIVDDGSRDETPGVLNEWKRRFPDQVHVLSQENSGPAAARNRGARAAKGSFVAFIDDDCIAAASWLRSLERALQETGAAAAGGPVINDERGWIGRYINRESVIDHVLARDGTVAELITANAAVRADVFHALGGFDEAIRVPGGEDTEFALRLRAAGHRIVVAPEARVRHQSRLDLADYLRMAFRHGRGRWRLGARFPEYRFSVPGLRFLWLAWPVRAWMARDYRRYRQGSVPTSEALRYVALRYLENLARMAGYIRGS